MECEKDNEAVKVMILFMGGWVDFFSATAIKYINVVVFIVCIVAIPVQDSNY